MTSFIKVYRVSVHHLQAKHYTHLRKRLEIELSPVSQETLLFVNNTDYNGISNSMNYSSRTY